MEPAIAYIPIDRQLSIAGLLDLPERTQGTSLFADISGFTPLTEALANELGPKLGAEELTRQLDAVYGALVAQVHAYRGTVIGFAGDAITCWFERDEGLRAIACGLAMQVVMVTRGLQIVTTPTGTQVTLGVKIAIASGPARRFVVGDPEVQLIDVLAGTTLDRMIEVEHHTKTGEVAITGELAARLEGKIVTEQRDEGGPHEQSEQDKVVVRRLRVPVEQNPWPDLPDGSLTEALVRPWILPGIYERVKAGQGVYLSEMRLCVPLFLRFGGIDYDHDPVACDKLDAYIRWVQSVLVPYEGSLLQVIIGDKGCLLYAAFGAIVAHDDDPVRAVAAAIELRSTPEQLAYITSGQIGITRGRTHAGPYGAPTRRTYGLLGDDVNLSARLMAKAEPGQIMVSRRVADAAHRHYNLRALAPIKVKGKKEPVPVSLVLGPRASAAEPSSDSRSFLVGRERELAAMSEALAAAVGGHGQVLRLEGPAGIGKSRLAAELARQAAETSVRVLQGICLSSDRSAYAPWRPIFRSLFGLHEGTSSIGEGEDEDPGLRLVREVDVLEGSVKETNPDWLLRLPLLGDLLGLPIPDNATTEAFEPRLRQSALFGLLADAVQTHAQHQPLLLIVDDVHWMDEASQGLAIALARAIAGAPVLAMLLSRPPLRDEQILPGLETLSIHQRLSLDELSPEAVSILVRDRLEGDADDLVFSLVGIVTQGNPFFVEEVIRSLRESGGLRLDRQGEGKWVLSAQMLNDLRHAERLVWSEGRWTLTPGALLGLTEMGLPDSVESAVLSRLDRLPEGPKLTLKVASVVGPTFPLDLLAQSHPARHPEPQLYRQVATLDTRGFTREEVPPPHAVHAFQHNVTHDVVYGTLLHAQRRQLHSAVGESLERLNPEAAAQLAYHTFLGEDWQRALHYQVLAGQQAQRLYANYEGIEHLMKALHSMEHLPPDEVAEKRQERQQIHHNLGMMLTFTSQFDAALGHLSAALDYAEDSEAKARACRWIGYMFEYKGDMASALEWINRGLDILGEDSQTAVASELWSVAVLIYRRLGQNDKAEEASQNSLRIATALGENATLAMAYNMGAIMSTRRGDHAGALEYLTRAVELYGQAGNIHGAALASNQAANVYFSTGRWVEADKYYRQARDVFSQTGDATHQMFADNNLGGIARDQGRLDDALRYYESALRAAEQLGGSPFAVGGLHINLGNTLNRRGDLEAARRHLNAGLEVLTRANIRGFLSELHRCLAVTALLSGDLDEARHEVTQAIELAREFALPAEEGPALVVSGEISAAGGELEEAERLTRAGLEMLRILEDKYQAARAELALARVLLKQGRAEEAALLLDNCREAFEWLEARLDLRAVQELRDEIAVVK